MEWGVCFLSNLTVEAQAPMQPRWTPVQDNTYTGKSWSVGLSHAHTHDMEHGHGRTWGGRGGGPRWGQRQCIV